MYSVRNKPSPPPGLTKPIASKNAWEALDDFGEEDEESVETRKSDMKEMEKAGSDSAYTKDFPKAAMANYSKKSVKNMLDEPKKQKFQPIDKKNAKTLAIFEKIPLRKDLSPMVKNVVPAPNEAGWRRMKSVMDSGASESVSHPGENPDYEVMPSPGSISGQKYVSASGDDIENEGEQILEAMTMEGVQMTQKYQSAEVHRPLNSISEICDAGGDLGQLVVFSKWGGVVYNPDSWRTIPFQREEGIYTLDTWVKVRDNKAAGFPRQGGK